MTLEEIAQWAAQLPPPPTVIVNPADELAVRAADAVRRAADLFAPPVTIVTSDHVAAGQAVWVGNSLVVNDAAWSPLTPREPPTGDGEPYTGLAAGGH